MNQTNPFSTSEARQRWEERYTQGSTPWDTGITPPEVHDFWASGRLDRKTIAGQYALDLGCGTGTNSAFLAGLGLNVLGFDLSFTALQRGQSQRAEQRPPPPQSMLLNQASVHQLPVADGTAIYVLDVGCMHSLPVDVRNGYAKEVVRSLLPGGYYQLYAFDWEETPDSPRRWLASHEAERLFAQDLEFVEIIQANPAPQPCKWYLLRKPT